MPHVVFDEGTADVIIEYSHIATRQKMQELFANIAPILSGLEDFNTTYDSTLFDWETAFWDIATLKKRFSDPSFEPVNNFAYKFVLFIKGYNYYAPPRFDSSYFGEEYWRYFRWGRLMKKQLTDTIAQQLLQEKSTLQKELLHLCLVADPEKSKSLLFDKTGYLILDRETLLNAVKQNWKVFNILPKYLQIEHEFLIAAAMQDSSVLEAASSQFKDDMAIIEPIIYKYPMAMKYLGPQYTHNKKIALRAVQKDGRSLEFFSDDLKNDDDVVRTAVQDFGKALEFASERLRNNENIALDAIKNPVSGRRFVGKELMSKRSFILAATRQKRCIVLLHAPDNIRNDMEFVQTAAKIDPHVWKYAGDALKEKMRQSH